MTEQAPDDFTGAEYARARLDDDLVVPFEAIGTRTAGRLVRLGSVVDTILSRHDYPEPVSQVLGQAVALTALLGALLKIRGRLILQTKSSGPVGFLVVDFEAPGRLRGYASFDADRVAAWQTAAPAARESLLGKGHLAMTIDQGLARDRYQGVVELDGQSLTQAAHVYFAQSEQLPTYIRLAVAKHYSAAGMHWRAGGLLIQQLADGGGYARATPDGDPGFDQSPISEQWTRARLLAGTVEDHELLDPTLAPDRLLYRLFHEEHVRAYPPMDLAVHCRCSEDKIEQLIKSFPPSSLVDMVEDGKIIVTCEFCKTVYEFPAKDYVEPN